MKSKKQKALSKLDQHKIREAKQWAREEARDRVVKTQRPGKK